MLLLREINETIGDDDRDGDARAAARRALRASDDPDGRRQNHERRGARVKARDLMELAARNLREAIFRNSLTTLGIGVGVASLVAMLSLGVGLQNLASDSLSHSGLFNAIIVTPRTNFAGFGGPRRANPAEPAAATPIVPLDDSARHTIAALPNVTEVYPEIRFPTRFTTTEIRIRRSWRVYLNRIATADRLTGCRDIFFRAGRSEAILQIDLAKQLSEQPYSLIGKELVLRYAERSRCLQRAAAEFRRGRIFHRAARRETARCRIVTTEPSAGRGGLATGGC